MRSTIIIPIILILVFFLVVVLMVLLVGVVVMVRIECISRGFSEELEKWGRLSTTAGGRAVRRLDPSSRVDVGRHFLKKLVLVVV